MENREREREIENKTKARGRQYVKQAKIVFFNNLWSTSQWLEYAVLVTFKKRSYVELLFDLSINGPSRSIRSYRLS